MAYRSGISDAVSDEKLMQIGVDATKKEYFMRLDLTVKADRSLEFGAKAVLGIYMPYAASVFEKFAC